MRIGIAGPIDTANIKQYLYGDVGRLPRGYSGAPLMSTLIEQLLKNGHEIVAFTTSSDIDVDMGPVEAVGDRFRVIYCPVRRRAFRYEQGHWGRAADMFRLERSALRRAMLDEQPDIIHAHWTYEFAWAAIDTGLPHVITCHDAPQVVLRYMPNLYRLVRYFMARHVLARAHNITAVSPYLKDKVQKYSTIPVKVVPNPLPMSMVSQRNLETKRLGSKPTVAMVLNGWGRLKNPKPALLGFSRYRRRYAPDAKMLLIGHDYGPEQHAQQWAKANGITEGLEFLGFINHTNLINILKTVDILLHPSLEESGSMAIIEAMAFGIPVIGGVSSGAVPWLVDNSGLLVDVKSPDAIENAIRMLMHDEALYHRCSVLAARRALELFAPDRVVSEYEGIYLNIINMTASRRGSKQGSSTISCRAPNEEPHMLP